MSNSTTDQARMLLPVQAFELRPSTGFLFDLSAFVLGDSGKVRCDEDFVFYGNHTHFEGALLRNGNVSPDQWNDLWVDLTKVSATAKRIAFVLSYYSDSRNKPGERNRGLELHVGKARRRMDESQVTICLPHTPSEDFTVFVGELIRVGDRWEFAFSGELRQGGLKEACQSYGIDAA